MIKNTALSLLRKIYYFLFTVLFFVIFIIVFVPFGLILRYIFRVDLLNTEKKNVKTFKINAK